MCVDWKTETLVEQGPKTGMVLTPPFGCSVPVNLVQDEVMIWVQLGSLIARMFSLRSENDWDPCSP